MRSRILLTLVLAVLVCSSVAALAQRGRGKGAARLKVFSAMVYAVEPNIETILAFTDDQKDKYRKAVQETIQSSTVLDLKRKKGEPADRAKQANFVKELTKARADLKQKVDEILTSEQKATIQKVDDAVKHSLDSVLTKEQKENLEALKTVKKGKKRKKGT